MRKKNTIKLKLFQKKCREALAYLKHGSNTFKYLFFHINNTADQIMININEADKNIPIRMSSRSVVI